MAETATAPDASRPRVYISYSRDDSVFAGRLALVLDDRGFEPVIDRDDVDPGEVWKARVRPLILSSDQVIVILTAKSAVLDSVRWEADLAAGSGKRIVVVVPAPLEDGIVLSPPLSASPWFHFYQHPTRADSGIYAGPALENALKADLAWRRQYTSLFLLAEKWKEHQDGDELLLRDAALTGALSWRESIPRGQTLISAVADFLDASEQAEAHRVVPADEFESRLRHLEERRAAAKEAAHAARARRQEATTAPTRILTPTQLADLPLAPVHAPGSLPPAQPADRRDSLPEDASPERENAASDDASPRENATRRKAGRAGGKGLVAPTLIALLMFAGAGVVVWLVVPQYLASSQRVAGADPSAVTPSSDTTSLPPANTARPEAPTAALAETSALAPTSPEVSPEPAPPVQAAAEPAAPAPTAEDPAAGQPPEEADWLAARQVGNIAAFRTYMLKWPKGDRYDRAHSAVRKRIETLSTRPESQTVVLPGPVAYRELPTFRDKGVAEGAAGQVVNILDRIASPREGEWLVLERDGAWPFRFVSARDIESARQQ